MKQSVVYYLTLLNLYKPKSVKETVENCKQTRDP